MTQLNFLITMGLFFSILGCAGDGGKNKATVIDSSIPIENVEGTVDQKARRAKSEANCKQHGIPFYKNPNALFSPPESEVTLRTKDEVVDRVIALMFMELKSEGPEQELLDNIIERFDILNKMSPKEKLFAKNANPSQQDMANANWRAESHHVLLWALGYIDELKYPSQMCQVAEDFKHLFSRQEDKFRAEAVLRSKQEILDAADQILRYNWAVTSARIKGEAPPGDLNQSVVFERHYALNWLIKNRNQDWDDVTTDT